MSAALFLLFAALAASVAAEEHTLHEVMSKTQHGLYFGGESDPDYDLLTPTSRDAEGEYLSHQLFTDEKLMSARRQRRHADNHDEERTFLHLKAFGDDHHLELRRNRGMFHENFAINIHDANGEMRTHTYATDCFHHGNIKSHGDSELAMSNCGGLLMGTIRKKREVYHVHSLSTPLTGHATHNPEGHTHIIHRVREKTSDEQGHNKNDEQLRERSKRRVVEPPPVNESHHFCNDGKVPMTSGTVLKQRMTVDMADTLVLNEFARQSAPREFGNNFVHAAIFIDHTMVEKYDGDEDFLTRYHLTMFNMVNLIYQPSKSQYAVYILLINVRIFTSRTDGLYVTQDSKRLLKNFCSFQQALNPGLGHPHRWNHAFLVTGYGLCFGQSTDCGELGRAPIEGVCTGNRECSVNREGGLNTAFVLAHELGHNLGMFHDGHPTEAAYCPASDGYLMKSTTADAPRIWTFSSCSVAHLRRYLRSEFSACMDKGDRGPTIVASWQRQQKQECRRPPGQMYDIHKQCELQWKHRKHQFYTGHSFKFCSRTSYGRDDICTHLYCDNGRLDQGCYSTFTPAMDGTTCGFNKVCWRYQCVPAQTMYVEGNYCAPEPPTGNAFIAGNQGIPLNPGVVTRAPTQAPTAPPPPVAVNGGWGFYSAFSSCSATCGGGIQYRERVCNKPSPSNGGLPCQGDRRMYQVCGTKPCIGGRGYRETQCQRIGASWHKSVIRSDEEPCSLMCEQRNLDGVVTRRHFALPSVDDGTICTTRAGYSGRCIRDTCTPVGCDNFINSTARVDECGVCKGMGESCKAFNGAHQSDYTTYGFHPVPLRGTGNAIFNGSWDIELNFTRPNEASLMVLRDNNNKGRTYFLHGPGTAIRSGAFAFPVAGAIGQYYHKRNRPQSLRIHGKINTPLVLEVLYWPERGQPNNVKFHWKSPVLPPSEKFEWVEVRPYGVCSVTCGRGVQKRKVRCRNKQTGGFSRDVACLRAGHLMPAVARECARAPCGTFAVFMEPRRNNCSSCSGQVKSKQCVAINSQGIQMIAPRLCNRMERMEQLEECAQATCETNLQFCHEDQLRLCEFYQGPSAPPCPRDLMTICSKTCKACEIMTGIYVP